MDKRFSHQDVKVAKVRLIMERAEAEMSEMAGRIRP